MAKKTNRGFLFVKLLSSDNRQNLAKWGILLGLLALLVFSLAQLQTVQKWWLKATGSSAHIVVPLQRVSGKLPESWNGVSQGLEGDELMFEEIVQEIRDLDLEYIRIDHVLSNYDLVSREAGELKFDFQRLDSLISTIVQAGAKPAISLSYMPIELSEDGTVTGAPDDWSEWSMVVETVISHYSSDEEWGISDVIYEVWNEPDLFGDWTINEGEKDYILLYQHTAEAAAKVGNAQPFLLGGPATTGMYPNWMEKLVEEAVKNNWKLDFLSWHRYSDQVGDFEDDTEWLDDWLVDNQYFGMKLFITEWGINSEKDDRYDTNAAAAHGVAVARSLQGKIDYLWPFELRDYESESGGWGMISNEGEIIVKKPRYRAWEMLSKLEANYVPVIGEGSWVKAIATNIDDSVKVIISNYDQYEEHIETVPVDILGLRPGTYQYRIVRLNGEEEIGRETINNSVLRKMIYLDVNEVVLFELERV